MVVRDGGRHPGVQAELGARPPHMDVDGSKGHVAARCTVVPVTTNDSDGHRCPKTPPPQRLWESRCGALRRLGRFWTAAHRQRRHSIHRCRCASGRGNHGVGRQTPGQSTSGQASAVLQVYLAAVAAGIAFGVLAQVRAVDQSRQSPAGGGTAHAPGCRTVVRHLRSVGHGRQY